MSLLVDSCAARPSLRRGLTCATSSTGTGSRPPLQDDGQPESYALGTSERLPPAG